jgi:predicted Zn-dependent protease with MMP-like domain
MSIFDPASGLGSDPGSRPDPEAFLRIAERALEGIPPELRRHVAEVGIVVEDLAGPHLLASMGLRDPWRLLGVYQGVPLTRRSVAMVPTAPDRIALFRLPILRFHEIRGGALEDVVRHVLIHEIGHHFGFSDDDMAAIDRQPD